MKCKLCESTACSVALKDSRRSYFICGNCRLMFVDAGDCIPVDAEKQRYDLHTNTLDDAGYVRFLQEVVSVVERQAEPSAAILDFGCGGQAVLTSLLHRRGLACTPYDPLYGRGPESLLQRYDIVILCEVIEHLRDLRREWIRIGSLLNPRGRIIVRTQLYPPLGEFDGWWYKNDCTHINFFCRETLSAAARLLGKTSAAATGFPDIFIVE